MKTTGHRGATFLVFNADGKAKKEKRVIVDDINIAAWRSRRVAVSPIDGAKHWLRGAAR